MDAAEIQATVHGWLTAYDGALVVWLALIAAAEGVFWARTPVGVAAYWRGMIRNVVVSIAVLQAVRAAAFAAVSTAAVEEALRFEQPNAGKSPDRAPRAPSFDEAPALADQAEFWMAIVTAAVVVLVARSTMRLAAGRLIDIGRPPWIALFAVFPPMLLILGLIPSGDRKRSQAASPWTAAHASTRKAAPTRAPSRPQPRPSAPVENAATTAAVLSRAARAANSSVRRRREISDGPSIRR